MIALPPYPHLIGAISHLTEMAYCSSGRRDLLFPVYHRGNRYMTNDVYVQVADLGHEPLSLMYGYRHAEPRWQNFLHRYLPPREAIEEWWRRCQGQRRHERGEVGFPPFGHPEDGCLSFLSFRSKPAPTLTLVSRALKLFPMGLCDAWLMYLLSPPLASTWGPIRLHWHILSFQLDPTLALAYLQTQSYFPGPPSSQRNTALKAPFWALKRKDIARAVALAEAVEKGFGDPYRPLI